MNPIQHLDFNQEIVDNFMLFLHNMQLQQNTILSAQVSQLSVFNSLIHSSARERVSRTNSLPSRRPTRVFLNRNNNRSPINFSNFGSFLNTNVEVFPSTEQINNSTEILTFNNIENPQNTICPIRNENFNENDIVIRINHCGHIFFPNEFYGWFRNHVRCPMCRHDIRDSSNNITTINNSLDISNSRPYQHQTPFDISNSRPYQHQTQFDICYNIFGGNERIIPQPPPPPPSTEAINNQLNSTSRNNSFNSLNVLQMEEIDVSGSEVEDNDQPQINALTELTRTMASELVNQIQNNMFTDLSANQIEMSLSFMTPTIVARGSTPVRDISMNEID